MGTPYPHNDPTTNAPQLTDIVITTSPLLNAVTYTGYLTDLKCVELSTAGEPQPDGTNVLDAPWEHKVGCMNSAGPPACKDSGYGLMELDSATGKYKIKYAVTFCIFWDKIKEKKIFFQPVFLK